MRKFRGTRQFPGCGRADTARGDADVPVAGGRWLQRAPALGDRRIDATGRALVRYPLRLMPQENRDAVGVLNFALTQVVEEGTAKALHGLLGNDTRGCRKNRHHQ